MMKLCFQPRRLRRCGFTLVELLVVIGVIALLISILLPALNRARESAKSIKCQAQLRQIGQAMLMHANEHKQCMPLSGALFAGSDTHQIANPANLADASMQKYTYLNDPGAEGPIRLRPTPLPAAIAPYLNAKCRSDSTGNVEADLGVGPVHDIFLCPSDNRADNATTADMINWGILIWDRNGVNYTTGYTSYFMNSEALGFCPGITNNSASIVGHSRAAGFIPAMANPTQLLLLGDGLYSGGTGTFGTFDFWAHNTPATLADVFNGGGTTASGSGGFDGTRHRGKMNALFLDGHVENLTITNTGGTDTSGAGITASGDLGNVYIDKDFRQ